MKRKVITGIAVVSVLIAIITILVLNANRFDFKNEFERYNGAKTKDGNTHITVDIGSKNEVYLVKWDDVAKLNNKKEDAIIFIGNPTCEYCRSIAENIIYATNSIDDFPIYYLRNNDINYDELSKIFGGTFTKEKLENGAVVFLINGSAISYNFGTVSSHINPYEKLDEDQKMGLYKIYENGINLVLESKRLKASINSVK